MHNLSAIDIYSIEYGYVPTLFNRAKCLFVTTKFSPPKDLQIGEGVMIKTTDSNFVPPPGDLYIVDIIGTRIVIASRLPGEFSQNPVALFRPKNDDPGWTRLDHGDHWGYNTRSSLENKVNPTANRNWIYGSGDPVGVLIW